MKNDFKSLLEDLKAEGFEEELTEKWKSSQNSEETYVVYFHRSLGLLAVVSSYSRGISINGGRLYGEALVPLSMRKRHSLQDVISYYSGRVSCVDDQGNVCQMPERSPTRNHRWYLSFCKSMSQFDVREFVKTFGRLGLASVPWRVPLRSSLWLVTPEEERSLDCNARRLTEARIEKLSDRARFCLTANAVLRLN